MEYKEKKEERTYLLILGIISILTFFTNLWTRGANLMESRNFITSREIVESGNWMVTTLNGEYRFEKPPLPSWLTAGAMKITGNFHSEWILRLPVAITALITVFFIYRFVKKLTGNVKTAFYSSLVFTTSFLVIKTAGENTWDFYPYAFMFIGITYLLQGFTREKLSDYLIGGIFLGASVLSKGPVGVYGMFLPFLISYGVMYGVSNFRKNWVGILIFVVTGIAVTAVWPIYMLIENRELFISVLKKESETWGTIHKQPFYFYLNFFYLNGIWSFFTIMWSMKFWSNKRTLDRKNFDFIYLWHIIAFILLSVIKMKKERYGLPLYFTSSIGIGFILNYYSEKGWGLLKKSDKVLLNIQGILLMLVSLTVPILFYLRGYRRGVVSIGYVVGVVLIFGIFLAIFLRDFIKNKNRYVRKLALHTGVLMAILSLTTIWFIERGRKDIYEGREKYLKNFKIEAQWEKLPVYAESFAIWDVWNIGREIKKTEIQDEEKERTENREEIYLNKGAERFSLPDEFIYFSQGDEMLEDNLPEFLKGYKISGEKRYFRAIDEKKNVTLYHMEKE